MGVDGKPAYSTVLLDQVLGNTDWCRVPFHPVDHLHKIKYFFFKKVHFVSTVYRTNTHGNKATVY